MFQDIGHILTNLPRQAEAADTRQHIRRHDPDQERRKRKKGGFAEPGAEEQASLSVAALIAFLENITQKPAHDFSGAAQIEKPETPDDAPGDTPRNGQAMYAARAYGHAAQTNPTEPVYSAQDTNNSGHNAAPSLSQHDAKIAHQLTKDLKKLSKAGIEHLVIEPGGDFMSSLQRSIQTALAAIPE